MKMSSKKLSPPSAEPRLWTGRELALLQANAKLGIRGVAELLGRSRWSVRSQCYRSRISLRRERERRGSVLGQPTGVSLKRRLVEELKADNRLAEAVARRMKINADFEICPWCGCRPITQRSTGLCRTCHVSRLSEITLSAREEVAAERRAIAERQALTRARRESS
jgi:hypothetical protein